jgi:hypothetical protein
MKIATVLAAAALLAGACLSQAAQARTLDVGPDQAYHAPSEAIAAARRGDTVRISPGRYFDCAIVTADNVTIEGTGPNTVLTDKTCEGKALLVIKSNQVTVRNLVLQRARVVDGNGAGIRGEGGDLTIANCQFLDNENGVLVADNASAKVSVVDSSFVGNGKCGAACAHGIYVNRIALLHIERSQFRDTHAGHHIKSRAFRTEVVNNDIADGPAGDSSFLVDIPNGGAFLLESNRMEKGPHSSNPSVAVMIGEEGVDRPTDELTIRNNRFVNDQNRSTDFIRNITATPAQLTDNVLVGQVRPLAGDGGIVSR